jgi:hypothetical protein
VIHPLLGSGVFAADGEKRKLRSLQMDCVYLFFCLNNVISTGELWKYVFCYLYYRFLIVTYSIHTIRFHRSMTRPFFTKDRISHFENFDRHADEVIHQLKTRLNEGYAVDIQVWSVPFTKLIFSTILINFFCPPFNLYTERT